MGILHEIYRNYSNVNKILIIYVYIMFTLLQGEARLEFIAAFRYDRHVDNYRMLAQHCQIELT